METVLLLGAGHVGTFSARAVAEQGARVVAADVQPAPGFFSRFGPREAADLIAIDILDPGAVERLIRARRVDRVILAAGPTREASARDPERVWRIHIEGALAVGRAARATGVRRLVYVSSFAVYGRPEADRIDETMPARPRSDYGRAKVAAEDVLIRFRDQGLDVRILRPCGLYGPHRPGAGSQSAKVIDDLLTHSLRGERMMIQEQAFADEFLYVKDLGRAIALATLGEPRSEDCVFNVGPGQTTSAAELCRAMRRAVPAAQLVLHESGNAKRLPCAPLRIERIRAALGFEPSYSLSRGLCDYLHETGLRP